MVIPLSSQRTFWNDWNAKGREQQLGEVSRRQAEIITGWLVELGRTDLNILDAGCGTGWLCAQLKDFGQVTGTDLADEVLERAKRRIPEVTFIAGDFMDPNLPLSDPFDVIVSLEVLSCVADQPAFMKRLSDLLKPGGYLILATPNRPVLERNDIPPPGSGQIRKWVDRAELKALLAPHFDILALTTVTPLGHRGFLRLVNSPKLNAVANTLFGRHNATNVKEFLGLGWTLMVMARKCERTEGSG